MRLILYTFCLMVSCSLKAQQGASLSGNIQTNANVFLKDSSINAVSQPQYRNQFFGGENWINLNYAYQGLTAGIRYDMYLNSNLRNPNDSYTDRGIGRWYIKKQFDNFSAEVGNLYDQIGSGIIYKAYEQRPLFIDNSLLGASLKYKFNDHVDIKAFGGQQKNAFDIYSGSIKGANLNTYYTFGTDSNQVSLASGIGFVNKTLSDETMGKIVGALQTYLDADRFGPFHNSYATTIYNTLTFKGFTWYVEAAFKNKDIFYNPMAEKQEFGGGTTFGKLVNNPGSVIYTSLSYAQGNLGITLESKRTENFSFRIDPNLRLLRGLISYIPPMNRQNTYRLTARYSPAAQEISEQAFQLDVRYKINQKFSLLVNASNINNLDYEMLFREYLLEGNYKLNKSTQIIAGLQRIEYNQEVYEQKPDNPIVKTIVPYIDVLYKISRKKSIRTEVQYMSTQQDYGSWLFALVELGLAPRWIFEVSGMYNIDPKITFGNQTSPQKALYPSFGAVYNRGANRFSLRYVKQVEGVVCSGGICRLEPAFSGVRFSLTSSF